LAEYGQVDQRMNEMKRIISNLQERVYEQESQLINMQRQRDEVIAAQGWLHTWGTVRNTMSLVTEAESRVSQYQQCWLMSVEDKESAILETWQRREKLISQLQSQLASVITEKQSLLVQSNHSLSQRLGLVEEVQKVVQQRAVMQIEYIASQEQLQRVQSDYQQVLIQQAVLTNTIKENILQLEEQQRSHEEMRRSHAETVTSLSQQLHEMQRDFDHKENDNDNLRKELKSKKVRIS
jgi:DNA repair exonuclease SbcCD ATPase subunit